MQRDVVVVRDHHRHPGELVKFLCVCCASSSELLELRRSSIGATTNDTRQSSCWSSCASTANVALVLHWSVGVRCYRRATSADGRPVGRSNEHDQRMAVHKSNIVRRSLSQVIDESFVRICVRLRHRARRAERGRRSPANEPLEWRQMTRVTRRVDQRSRVTRREHVRPPESRQRRVNDAGRSSMFGIV
jgi:hypothetical protein